MITRKYVSAIVIFCTISTILLIVWNTSRRDDLYITILNSDEIKVENPAADEDKLFDLNFKYIINSEACERRNLTKHLAVLIVTSYFANVERRSAMRRAFRDEDLATLGLARVFLLGSMEDNRYITQNSIRDEGRKFGDIVQGNFKEAYRNLTYKHVMGLRWATRFCGNAKYVVKMDDDIVFDVYRTAKLINEIKLPEDNYVGGYILKDMTPIREPANKWYTTLDEYEASRYPTFVSGWFYITTAKFCARLASLSKLERYFWIDDVYVTGILAQKLGVRFLNLNRYFAVHAELMQCCLQDFDKFQCDFLIGPNGGNDEMFYTFNKLAMKCSVNKCPARSSKPLNVSCVVAGKDVLLGRGKAIVQPYKLN